MDQQGELVSEPFDLGVGGRLLVEASASRRSGLEPIEFAIEGSADKAHWSELASGTVRDGERVEVACRDRPPPWGRVRFRASGGDARLHVRGRWDGVR
jgi:hypothetical protein